MLRPRCALVPALVLQSTACFTSNDPVVPGAPTSDGTMSGGQTDDLGSTGAAEAPADTTGAPDTGISTSAGPDGTTAVADGSTGLGAECRQATDCDGDLLCIDLTCQSCAQAGDPDAACAENDAATPLCDSAAGACAACVATSCSGSTPVCDAVAGCGACTEHAQCPDSACHLMGAEQGACFDVADVVEVSDVTELAEALAIGMGAQRVINLSAETFTVSGSYTIAGEVAILGQPGTVITGGATNVFSVGGGTGRYLYLSNLAMDTGPFRAIRCDASNGVWLDDMTIENYAIGVYSGGETHVRRSRLTNTDTNGAAALDMFAGGELFAENTMLGPGGQLAIQLFDAAADLRYVTIAGNVDGIVCSNEATGSIRNSIVVNDTGNSIQSSCFLSFVDNAVDGGFGMGDVVGPYDASWFVAPGAGDLHLSAAGQAVFADIADWDAGDPLTDLDGDARPQTEPGYPGVDEIP